MNIEIWSDIVCPFCYIGKRHLELALEQFEHRQDVHITWRSFELDPTAPATADQNLVDMIAEKYGITTEQSEASQHDVATRAQAVGLTFNWQTARYGNTFDAHRLIHLAQEHGLQDEAEEAFKKAYFTDSQSVGEHDVLQRYAESIGLPAPQVAEVLASNQYADAVRADEMRARELGIQGVPFFLIDAKWAINGAQPVEAILQGLRSVWVETHPASKPQFITLDGAEEAPTCGPNGC